MTSTADQAYGAASVLIRALAAVGAPASICEPEKLSGRASGRIRVVLRQEHAHTLTAVLADYLDHVAEPTDAEPTDAEPERS